MYGGGIKHNFRAVVKAMTFRRNAIFLHATIGGARPWYTDNMLQLPMIEADLFAGLKTRASTSARSGRPGRAVEHCVCGDQSARRRRREASTRRDADVLEAGVAEDRGRGRHRRRRLGRQRRPVRDGLPPYAPRRHRADPQLQHDDRGPDDQRTRRPWDVLEDPGSTAPFRSARTTCARTSTAVRSSHSPRRRPASPSSARTN